MKMRGLLKSINVLNLVLAAAVLFSLNHSVKNYSVMGPSGSNHLSGRPRPVLARKKGNEAAGFLQDMINGSAAADSLDSYAIIGKQNLFNPGRTIPAMENPVTVKSQPLPRPALILRGTLIMGGQRLAYIEQRGVTAGGGQGGAPVSPPWASRAGPPPIIPSGLPANLRHPAGMMPGTLGKVKTYRIGDQISGFVLKRITPDSVIFDRGKESMTVYLYNPVKDLSSPRR